MSRLPRLAVITTIYHPTSHSDVIVSRWLEPRETDREANWPHHSSDSPRTRIASMYIQQFPENDTGRATSERHGVPIYPTVREALTLGGDELAVDGVLLIAEHGDFPHNEFYQHLYPRRELFDEIVAVFRECGRSVPVFNDKHLSYNADSARHMAGTAQELGFPLMAGSSVPLGDYHHELELNAGLDLEEGIGLFYCGVESYGYHSIDFLQSLVARRAGGEAGIASVTAYAGDGFWRAHEEGVWSSDVMEAALAAVSAIAPGDYKENIGAASVDNLSGYPQFPAALCFEHRDGFKSSHLFLHGHIRSFVVGIRERNGRLMACYDHRSSGADFFYRHFARLNARIEEFMLTGKSPYPIEHYLLCTLAIDRGVRALATPGLRIETPELDMTYSLGTESIEQER